MAAWEVSAILYNAVYCFRKRDFQNGTVAAVFTDLLKEAFGRAFSFLKGRQKYPDAKI